MKKNMRKLLLLLLVLIMLPGSLFAAKWNAWDMKMFSVETPHFRIHFPASCEHLTGRVASKLEELYGIYKNTYGISLPPKTDVVILDSDIGNGWSLAQTKTITINTVDFDFNMRGSHDWFDDVITHEYAHGVSIWASLKTESPVSDVRLGFFSHPNQSERLETFHIIPKSILPHWFSEGIAQYESTLHGADTWDAHRDMILRTLTLSGNLLSWDQMQVFTGRGDDYEKTYNHGFSLVMYIKETYGYDKVVSLLYESAKFPRLDFDGAIKSVLGISGRRLYKDWKQSLEQHYKSQVDSLGKQVFGKKINKSGYVNFQPFFSPDGKCVYHLSSGKSAYGRTFLTLTPVDTTVDTTKIKNPLMRIGGMYDIDGSRKKILFTSSRDKESKRPSRHGGEPTRDLFIDTLPDGLKKPFALIPKKTEKRLTTRQSIFNAAFSPTGNVIAAARRVVDHFELVLIDTTGKNAPKLLYPSKKGESTIGYIYSIDWSPDGKTIAFSYFDKKNRNVALYDTASGTCEVLFNTGHDERDPQFSPDGKHLYFASDRTGIFNIYRYNISSKSVEKVTNVSGGAFVPSVSPDGKKLVYTGYDNDGHSIYLLDSIRVLETIQFDSILVKRPEIVEQQYAIAIEKKKPYHYFPRQVLLSPIVIGEKLNDKKVDAPGTTAIKTGLALNLIEPLTLSNIGSELGALFLIEPSHIFDFFSTHGTINPAANFDLTLFGKTNRLPLTLSSDYSLRGISNIDEFFNETEGTTQKLLYGIRLHNFNIQIDHSLNGSSAGTGASLSLLMGLNSYDVALDLEAYSLGIMEYNLSKGYRAGLMYAKISPLPEPEMVISPRGLAYKLQYDFWGQNALKEENSFSEGSIPKEQYDKYQFHQVTGHIKSGLASPIYNKHTVHLDLKGTAIHVIKQDQKLPSYYLPVAWIPGYTYYYRDIKNKPTSTNDSAKLEYDTVLVTGKAVVSGEVSYRFPLWKGMINKKLGFLHLEHIYGGVHLSGGAGFVNPEDIIETVREDWLLSAGGELRLETKSFNSYPMAFKFRYDRGFDNDKYGGNRFLFSLGFDFDGWGNLTLPDQHSPALAVN
jgi:WD40 repeat protein